MEFGTLVSGRSKFNAQAFLTTNKLCGAGHLVGAFEFVCSTPDGADPKNPDRPCPAAEPETSTSSDNTTPVYSGTSGHGSLLQAIVSVVLLHVLLV